MLATMAPTIKSADVMVRNRSATLTLQFQNLVLLQLPEETDGFCEAPYFSSVLF